MPKKMSKKMPKKTTVLRKEKGIKKPSRGVYQINKETVKAFHTQKAALEKKKAAPPKNAKALGRGLSALLSDHTPAKKPASLEGLDMISLRHIQPNPNQPRKQFNPKDITELSQSITTYGIIQPLTVRHMKGEQYQLIAGERRFLAAKQAGITQVPVFIRKVDDREMLEMALVENIQRENLNALEIAFSYQRLIYECDLKQEEMAQRVGKDRSTITNYLRLLRLPDTIQVALRDELISMGHARSLLAIEHVETQIALLKEILEKKLSVRDTENRVSTLPKKRNIEKRNLQKRNLSTSVSQTASSFSEVEKQLTHYLNTKVSIHKRREGKGECRISFYSEEDLHRLAELIAKTS